MRLDRTFVQDPHALYRRLRAEAPAHPVVMWGGVRAWLITRYAEARALLNDPRLSKDQARALALFPPGTERLARVVAECQYAAEGSTGPHPAASTGHQGLHGGAVEQLRPRIERITDELLDAIEVAAATGAVDLMEFFAAPLPMRVIGELLGVPVADREKLQGRS